MNQAYEEPLVFTSNKQSKLYFSQVLKYPCNSKIISTHLTNTTKFNLPINKKRCNSSSTIVIDLINFIHKQRILSISNSNEEEKLKCWMSWWYQFTKIKD